MPRQCGKSNKKCKAMGDKMQVWMGEAHHTRTGITKDGLMVNKRNQVVYKKRSERAKELWSAHPMAQYMFKPGHNGRQKQSDGEEHSYPIHAE